MSPNAATPSKRIWTLTVEYRMKSISIWPPAKRPIRARSLNLQNGSRSCNQDCSSTDTADPSVFQTFEVERLSVYRYKTLVYTRAWKLDLKRMAVASQSMRVCAPATAAVIVAESSRCSLPASSACAVLSPKWGEQGMTLRARFGQSLRLRGRSASSSVRRQRAVAQLSDFAVQESEKFREGLLQQLEGNPTTASEKVKIADVCVKIFGDYLEKYDGTLSPEPFAQMKAALDSQNLPASQSVISAALGWSRVYLHFDWKTAQQKN
ncbi:hypothetical protein R1flu_009747 [Riccia fluitans]|uniref:Uncharacterized protein n=1 Tax=Riccia fluitans TaxID=41844 RepID=A0ABD1Z372_9MARC